MTRVINRAKRKGVILGKDHVQPVGTLKLKKSFEQKLELTKKLDSKTAIRGAEQVRELFDMLQGKMNVKVNQKLKDGPINLAIKDTSLFVHDEDDDDLDWVFEGGCVASASGSAGSGGGGRHGGGGANPGGGGGGGAGGGGGGGGGGDGGGGGPGRGGGGKIKKALHAGERALLAAKQELNAYLAENEELVGPKGIKTVLDKLNERMIPKCVDIYVEATGFMGAADGVTMTGMDLYEQMREVSSQLSVCVPLAQALNKKRDEVDIGQVMETMEAAAAVVNVSMGTVKGVWEIMVWAEFDKGNYQMSVYRLLPVNSGLPASVVQKIPAPEALKFQETFTVDAVLKLLRGNGMADDCVKFAKELRPFLTHLPESSYTKDVASWCDIVLVQNAGEQDLERIASIKNAYSKEAGDYQSRFARVMKCFDTGRLLMSRVDTELAAAKAQEGLVLILKDFCQNMPNIWPLRGLSEDPVIIVPEQVAALKSVQEDLAKLEGTATNRFLSTHQKDVDDVKGFLENVRNDFGRAYGTRALKVMSERSFAPALPMFREICSNEKGSCKLDTDRVVT